MTQPKCGLHPKLSILYFQGHRSAKYGVVQSDDSCVILPRIHSRTDFRRDNVHYDAKATKNRQYESSRREAGETL